MLAKDMLPLNLLVEMYEAVFTNNYWKIYLEGLKNTLIITAFALIIGVVIGVLVAYIKYGHLTNKKNKLLKVLNWIANGYTTIIRGTPIILQVLIAYHFIFRSYSSDFAIPILVITFGINSGAYVSEIIRAGLLSVDKGQSESARSLGLSRGKTMRLVILPQAIKNILPSLFNEFISLLKETSIAGYLSIVDLTFAGDMVRSRSWSLAPLIVCAIIYLIMVFLLTLLQNFVERRFAVSDRG